MRFLPLVFILLCHSLVHGQVSGTFISQFDRYSDGYLVKEEISSSQTQIGWKGERVIFQALVWSSKTVNATITGRNFSGDNGNFSIKLKFPIEVKGDSFGKSCGAWSDRNGYDLIKDALSETPPTQITPNDTIAVWISVDVPRDIDAGLYKSQLTIDQLTLNMEIHVVERVLPPVKDWSFHLDLWQFPTRAVEFYNSNNPSKKIDVWSDKHFEMIMPAYELLADAGQKVITAHIKKDALGVPSMIEWIKQTDGTWTYDFTVFDKYVSALMQMGINKQISCFSPAGWNNTVIPYWDEQSQTLNELDAPIGSEAYAERWDHFLTVFRQHLLEKGWFDITVLYLDEVAEPLLDDMYNVIKANNQDWKLGIATGHALSASMVEKFYDISGILGVSTRLQNESLIKTFYTSCTQSYPNNYVTSSTSPGEMTWMAYYAAGNKFDGYLRWAYDNWRVNDPFDARDNGSTAGDFSMIYRSNNSASMKFLSSVRLEALREGIEDFEKIKILKEDTELAKEISKILARFHGNSGMNAKTIVPEAHDALAKLVAPELPVTGVEEEDRDIKIYPNPFSNEIIVAGANDPLTVSIISPVSGSAIISGSSNTVTTDLLAKGLYIVEVKSNGSRVAVKLMVKE